MRDALRGDALHGSALHGSALHVSARDDLSLALAEGGCALACPTRPECRAIIKALQQEHACELLTSFEFAQGQQMTRIACWWDSLV